MIRVALIDDHVRIRQSLRAYLESLGDMQVVAEGGNGAEAAAIAQRWQPDVLLMDLAMPGRNGMDALQALRAVAPGVPVLILSGYPPEPYAAQMLRLGAAGFLHKNCEPEQIALAVRALAAGLDFRPAADAAA
jgi:DNA-binding NarL/FixJ family response regulator